MSRFIKLLWAISLPGAFVLAGVGMLWLYTTLNPEMRFYERLLAYEAAWNGSHIVLLASAVLLVPAALAIWSLISGSRGAQVLAGIGLLPAVVAPFFLAGQYAIDFVMPLVAKTGEAAYPVHAGLFETPLINTLFYGLPDLGFIGFMLLTAGLVWCGSVTRINAVALGICWLAIIIGNVVDIPLLARPALIALGFAYIPAAKKLLSETTAG